MKNFLTKAFVCAGVLASALALSSVAVFAATNVIGDVTTINASDSGSTAKPIKDNSNEYTSTWLFTTNTTSYTANTGTGTISASFGGLKDAAYDFYGGSIKTTYGKKNSVKVSNNKYFTIAVDDGDTVTLDTASDNARKLTISESETDSTGEISIPTYNAEISFTFNKAGTYTLTSNGEFFLCAVALTKGGASITTNKSELNINPGSGDSFTASISNNTNGATLSAPTVDSTAAAYVGVEADAEEGGKYNVTVDSDIPESIKTATITLSSSDSSIANKTVTVNILHPALTLDKNSVEFYPGDTADVTAELTNISGAVSAVSNDASVATVEVSDKTITITGVAQGTTTITVTAGGKTETVNVTVCATDTVLPISTTGEYNLNSAAWTKAGGETAGKIDGLFADNRFLAVNDSVTAGSESAEAVWVKGANELNFGKQGKSYIEFSTTRAFKVTIPFAANGSSKQADLILYNADTQKIVAHQTTNGTSSVNLVVNNLPAGTYRMMAPTEAQGATNAKSTANNSAINATARGVSFRNGGKIKFEEADATAVDEGIFTANTVANGRVIIKGTDAYVIAYVPESLMSADKIKVNVNTGAKETSQVYPAVKIGTATYKATDAFTNCKAMYGIKISGITSNEQTQKARAITVEAVTE